MQACSVKPSETKAVRLPANRAGCTGCGLRESGRIDYVKMRGECGLPCINISREGGNQEGLQRSLEEWLSLIEHADYMLTDSFHGTAFSLTFGVSFISFDNPERGSSRFTSLLGRFGLQDRMRPADSEPLYAKIGMNRWAAVKSAMERERQRGLHFLVENLV